MAGSIATRRCFLRVRVCRILAWMATWCMTRPHTATTMQLQLACPRYDPHTPPVGLELDLGLDLGVGPERMEEEYELLHCHGQI